MRKLVVFILVIFVFTALYAVDLQSFVSLGTDFGASDSKESLGSLGIKIDGDFIIPLEKYEKFAPVVSLGLQLNMDAESAEAIEFAEDGLRINLSMGLMYRITKLFGVHGALRLAGFYDLDKKENTFAFNTAGADVGLTYSNGSIGVKGGAVVGYNIPAQLALIRPYISCMVGLKGNTVYRPDRENGGYTDTERVAGDLKYSTLGVLGSAITPGELLMDALLSASTDTYFRFEDPEKVSTPMLGYEAGFGYSHMGITLDGQFYGGLGLKTSNDWVFALKGGLGIGLGFFKGFTELDSEMQVLELLLGSIVPSGVEMKLFGGISLTHTGPGGVGFRLGADAGAAFWLNRKVGTRETLQSGTGLFVKAYAGLSFDRSIFFLTK